jgi:hypothetical protein
MLSLIDERISSSVESYRSALPDVKWIQSILFQLINFSKNVIIALLPPFKGNV